MTEKDRRQNIQVCPDVYRPDDRSWAYRRLRPATGRPAPGHPLRCLDGLTVDEQALTSALRALATVPHLAIRCFLVRGDLRLARALYDRLCLGPGPGQLIDQAGDDVG